MKTLLAILVLALAGCASYRAERDDAKCRSYGFKPGTQAYGQCRLQLESNHSHAAAAVGSAVIISRPRSCTGYGNTVTCY